MAWFKNHKRATCAIVGCMLMCAGLAMLWTFPAMLIVTGAALLGGTLLSYLPDLDDPNDPM